MSTDVQWYLSGRGIRSFVFALFILSFVSIGKKFIIMEENMKRIRKITLFSFLLLPVLVLFVLSSLSGTMTAFASAESTTILSNAEKSSSLETVESVFSGKSVSSYEYFYNLDDSADYIYIEFENGGYAVYAKDTMEMMEYSLQGNLPYDTSVSKKYYAGPSNYLQKVDGRFYNVKSGEQLTVSKAEAYEFANTVRDAVIETKATKLCLEQSNVSDEVLAVLSSSNNAEEPDINTGKLIPASLNGTLIENVQFFLANPKRGDNYSGVTYGEGNSGTCGPVAAQLLLGYNNFYNDRRIIPNKYLNGYDHTTNTVSDREKNPNTCSDPMHLDEWTTGTSSENTKESFYYKIITSIMKPNTSGASNKEVKNGMDKYLSEVLSSSDYSLKYEEKGWFFGYKPINSSIIKAEIDAGRPLILSMDSNLGGSNHDVVGYGYEDYAYATGEGTYSGYVVNFGWQGTSRASVWINANWCDGYVSLKMNHTHSYNYVGAIPNSDRTEYKCSTCGQRTDAAIRMSASDRYVERMATITQSTGKTHQDYYVTFNTAGNKLFQTFGGYDAKLTLLDAEYNVLVENDDSGHGLNSLFNYTVEANKAYILRVATYRDQYSGKIKVGITPDSHAVSEFEDIWLLGSNIIGCSFTSELNATRAICYTPGASGTYKFTTKSADDIDTYLYFIDPTSADACLYNDDGAGNLQAKIEVDLVAGRKYLLIVSAYSITTKSGSMGLSIEKLS